MKTTYLSCAQTAKLVRTALKRSFPHTTFSVRSKTYAGGASIDVAWTDGPCTAAVEPIARQFSGGHFDGSIDMATSHTSWLLPDGTACIASDPGTTGSAGSREPERNWMPDVEAKLVHFGADYVFCTRRLSVGLLQRVRDRLAAKGYPVEAVEVVAHSDNHGGYLQTVIWDRQLTRGFDMEREVYAAAQKTHCVTA